jgi:3-oxoacyl-[acyl-carrier protein] reductase
MEQKSIVLTGATGGLGKVILLQAVKNGHRVMMVNRSLEKTINLLSEFEIKKYKSLINFFIADFSSQDWIDNLGDEIKEKDFWPSALINNAGTNTPLGNTWEIDIDQWKHHFNINFFTPVSLISLLIPYFILNKSGAIINLSGGGATKPMPYFSPYAASKTALVRLTENIAIELKDLNISANAIAPGFLATNIHNDSISESSKIPNNIRSNILEEYKAGGKDPNNAAILILKLIENKNFRFSGNLLSAIWDTVDDKLLDIETLAINRFKIRRVEK